MYENSIPPLELQCPVSPCSHAPITLTLKTLPVGLLDSNITAVRIGKPDRASPGDLPSDISRVQSTVWSASILGGSAV